jgi:hypothetical protein
LETEVRDFAAGEGITKTFTVAVPDDAAPGQYITGLAVETAEGRSVEGGSPLTHKVRLATAVFITVPGPVEAGFGISDLAVSMDLTTTSFSGLITNTGNVRVRPEGSITLTDSAGATVVDAPIKMGSVYAHDAARFEVGFPVTSIPEGVFDAAVELEDPETGETASLAGVQLVVEPSPILPPVTISAVTITPLPAADNVVFVQVDVTIANEGLVIGDAALTLRVFRDGEVVAEHELASSLSLALGETVVSQPYIPADGTWQPGTYTFEVVLSAAVLAGGQTTEIDTFAADQELVVS